MVTVAVHKFSSCDGCQLAFLNAGQDLLTLSGMVDIVNFAEAGMLNTDTVVDIAFVEGSISTPGDVKRIQEVRNNCRFLVTIGACATSGGLQALRNMADTDNWISEVYASPEYISSLPTSTAISDHVKVDLELWGCPVSTRQLAMAVRNLLFGVLPVEEHDKICMECKRQGVACVMVTHGMPCMGPVTRTGCGALCPRLGRDCYACYGPAETPNTDSLASRFEGLGLLPDQVARKFLLISNAVPVFNKTGEEWKARSDD